LISYLVGLDMNMTPSPKPIRTNIDIRPIGNAGNVIVIISPLVV